MKKIICLGIAVIDQIYTLDDLPMTAGKHFAKDYLEVGGGPAATASVAVARLGGEVEFWGRVGGDTIGKRILNELESYGVDVNQVKSIDNATSSVSAVLVDKNGERLIVNRAVSGLDEDPSWLPLERLKDCSAVLVDSRWIPGAKALLQKAKELGIPSILDADSTPNDDISELVQLATHIAFSKNGLMEVSGEEDSLAGLKKLANKVEGWMCVTKGEKGTIWLEDGQTIQVPAFKTEVVDTLGAGDVFHGAFTYAIAHQMPLKEAVRFSNATAALKCRKLGGRAGIPSKEELDALLNLQV